ncbi:MAG: indole-3-glycerol phosphate synthase TrpC [bacterium]|nr:indole-3-glycerol phosphate synthase TrpC [bacterium]
MILDKIIEKKQEEIERKKRLPLPQRRTALRNFKSAISKTGINLIAEIKYGSPSLGEIKPKRKADYLAKVYENGGASAISCVTEKDFFFGNIRLLRETKDATSLPVLRKDFIIDPWQIEESLSYEADALLLIVRILSQELLEKMYREIKKEGLAAIFEVHTEEEIQRAIEAKAEIIGINNRDLQSFKCDLSTTLNLINHIPKGIVIVAESGIQKKEDLLLLEKQGVNAILVGEALLSAKDPLVKIKELLGD